MFCFFFNLFSFVANPKFSGPILNATVAVGRDAVLTCMVEDLGAYKVSFGCVNWLLLKYKLYSFIRLDDFWIVQFLLLFLFSVSVSFSLCVFAHWCLCWLNWFIWYDGDGDSFKSLPTSLFFIKFGSTVERPVLSFQGWCQTKRRDHYWEST